MIKHLLIILIILPVLYFTSKAQEQADTTCKPFDKDLIPYAQQSLQNFLVLNPEPFHDHPGMYRLLFDCYGLPPSVGHNQWDWGDGTSRAVEAWIDVRQMTGDRKFGRKIENGQRRLLLWLLAPETGMPYVPELSNKGKGTYYYHMWDQGRTLRALVHWWQTVDNPVEKQSLAQKINRLITSLNGLATKRMDARWGPISEYPYSVFNNGKCEESFAPMSGGQLIEPLAIYWQVFGDPAARAFTDALCNGVLAVSEPTANKSSDYRFGTDGSFTGHFHNKSSIVLGVARHAIALIRHGQRDRGLQLLHWAKSVYDWSLSPANVNCGSTWGWFPENVGDGTKSRTNMEICCTADMIELASVLASAASLDPTLSGYDELWDHVERYTLNTIIPSQFVITPAYANLVSKMGGNLKTAEQLVGGWAGYHPPNDLVTIQHDDGKHEMLMGSCCNYSGVRGLYACWTSVFSDYGSELIVRLPIARQSTIAIQTVVEGPTEVHQVLRLKADRTVRVRIPDWALIDKVIAYTGKSSRIGYSIEGRYINFGKVVRGTELSIVYPLRARQTHERIGGDGNHTYFTPADHKPTYTVCWKGNHIVSMQPQGNLLPVFPKN